jgi:hypothetical protein
LAKPNKFDGLMRDLCVGWGFCGCVTEAGEPRHVTHFIPDTGTVTADQFAEWAVQADWPRSYDDLEYAEYRATWVKRIAKLFAKHMGADEVDATSLQWAVD